MKNLYVIALMLLFVSSTQAAALAVESIEDVKSYFLQTPGSTLSESDRVLEVNGAQVAIPNIDTYKKMSVIDHPFLRDWVALMAGRVYHSSPHMRDLFRPLNTAQLNSFAYPEKFVFYFSETASMSIHSWTSKDNLTRVWLNPSLVRHDHLAKVILHEMAIRSESRSTVEKETKWIQKHLKTEAPALSEFASLLNSNKLFHMSLRVLRAFQFEALVLADMERREQFLASPDWKPQNNQECEALLEKIYSDLPGHKPHILDSQTQILREHCLTLSKPVFSSKKKNKVSSGPRPGGIKGGFGD